MTIIAWDGKTLAADRRQVQQGLACTVCKIFRFQHPRCLVGVAGAADGAAALLHWFQNGADPDQWPAIQQQSESRGVLMVIKEGGDILEFERGPIPVRFAPQQMALGSGRDYAMAAMHLGHGAIEAVNVACFFDVYCGNGVDVLTFEDAPTLEQEQP